MGRFKLWLEELEPERLKQLQAIWADTFRALGLDGMADEDAAQHSLSKVTYGERNAMRGAEGVFKGKHAVLKRLENGQIFARLEKTNDPELRKNVEETRHWLDLRDKDHAANASTTVSNLLQKLFGQDNFQKFIGPDVPKLDTAKAQVEPQPPKNSVGTSGESVPDGSLTEPPAMTGGPTPNGGPAGAQPQAQQGMMPPVPTNPMPPRPAGAQMGLF